jgi:hypothetical protein
MDSDLQDRIERVRSALQADPDGIRIGWVNAAAAEVPQPLQRYDELAQFLRVADGACCGEVVLFGVGQLSEDQFIGASLPGRRPRWLWLGNASDAPLVFDRETQRVSEADPEGATELLRCFGSVDELLRALFGSAYLTVAGVTSSRWYELLHALGLA